MNKLRMLFLLVVVIMAIRAQDTYGQGSLIWSQTFNDGGNAPSSWDLGEFWFGVTSNKNAPTQLLFDQVSPFGTEDIGNIYTIASSVDDSDFSAVSGALTAGVDQTMVVSFRVTDGVHPAVGSDYSFLESQLFAGIGTGPDLIGYEIQSFGLHIDNLSYQNPGAYSQQVTLNIYGSPIPEPSSSFLIFLASGVLIYARNRHKKHLP